MIKVNAEINNKSWYKKIKNPEKYLNRKLKKIEKIVPDIKKKNISFSILLTNSLYNKKLNKKFRKKNKTTDVLSFPFYENNKFEIKKSKSKIIYIGDIAVSFEIINRRAKKSEFFLEFDKVWIHGFLHLLGYDHIKNRDYHKMSDVEKKILISVV
jgi:probable rRNA maturation factor